MVTINKMLTLSLSEKPKLKFVTHNHNALNIFIYSSIKIHKAEIHNLSQEVHSTYVRGLKVLTKKVGESFLFVCCCCISRILKKNLFLQLDWTRRIQAFSPLEFWKTNKQTTTKTPNKRLTQILFASGPNALS